jgi:hypothetical protein
VRTKDRSAKGVDDCVSSLVEAVRSPWFVVKAIAASEPLADANALAAIHPGILDLIGSAVVESASLDWILYRRSGSILDCKQAHSVGIRSHLASW